MASSPLIDLIAVVLDVDAASITESTQRGDIDAWDSLAQLGVISALEETYGVMLSTSDMQECTSVSTIRTVLGRHGVEA
jgi:acyl carrier protein